MPCLSSVQVSVFRAQPARAARCSTVCRRRPLPAPRPVHPPPRGVPPAADKNALRTQLKVNMLRIRERELLFFTNNCLSISTSAVPPPPPHRGPTARLAFDVHAPAHPQALLAGFAWYGLTEVPFDLEANVVRAPALLRRQRAAAASPPRRPAPPRGSHPCPAPRASQGVQTLYLVVTTLIMGLELLTVVNATLCAILGPGLALRGPDGSMHNAVNGMMTHYKFTFACFTCGLLCFHVSALLYAWMQVLTLTLTLTLTRTRTRTLTLTLSLTCSTRGCSSSGTWRCPCPYYSSTSSGPSGATSVASSSASSSNPPAWSPGPSITTRRRKARPSRPPSSSPASNRHATCYMHMLHIVYSIRYI